MAMKKKVGTRKTAKAKPVKKAAPKVAKKAAPKKAAVKKPLKKKVWKPAAVKTKADFVTQLRESLGADLSAKAANDLMDNFVTILSESIKKNDRFTVPGFGTFNVKKRKARTGRNPQTGDKIRIKASKTITFKPTPKLKNKL